MLDDADPNRRRLTREEAVELLSRPLAGVFSSLGEGGWIHSVPVYFLYAADQVRFLTGAHGVKTRNVERTDLGSLCVQVTEGNVRSYVSVSGPATVHRPPEVADLRALDQKYDRDDFADGGDRQSSASEVMIVITTQTLDRLG